MAPKNASARSTKLPTETGYIRGHKFAVMYTPPSNKTRMLFTVWLVEGSPDVVLTLSAEAFAEFYPFTAATVIGTLGEAGDRKLLTVEDAQRFAGGLDKLFASVLAGDNR
jgi:hypothetical protein